METTRTSDVQPEVNQPGLRELREAVVNHLGQRLPSYHADFVILDRDIFTIDPSDIDKVSVVSTYISGEQVF